MLLQQLKEYYSNLLIVQYNGKPKATAHIQLLVDLVFANVILLQIQNAFDWKTAVGAQLDIIGKWVGVSRDYLGNLYWDNTFLSYPYTNTLVPDDTTEVFQHGYSDYSTFSDDGAVLTYENLGYVKQNLNDENYRTVIGLKIIKNSINHTAKNIDDAIWNYFNGKVYTTWAPHEITYNYDSSLETVMEVCYYKNVLPAPTGVNIVLRGI